MKRTLAGLATLAAAASLPLVATPTQAAAPGRPGTYQLQGDAGGSKFEGIGADPRRGLFYVSEVTGGEIHRGTATDARTDQWLDGDGTDGRFTARGITTDAAGRVYVAGGPNGIGTGRPDLWVYSPEGELLAALRAPGEDVFLNDVAIGPDGAAYFTNSNAPQVYRVALDAGEWTVARWADASGTIEQRAGFNLGGIVVSGDGSALVVAQGNVGALWRFDLATAGVTRVDTGDAALADADGLVLQGSRLTVVRNFARTIATLQLTDDGHSATLVEQQASDPTRVLTTAKVLRGRILYVDSKFDEAVAVGPYEVVTEPLAR
ncbi:SMP-30/gluconolactonase/LRE family protein [Terrabacter sp. MAHUQ-38]|uniref:SMP-30/gluconolactonase/LRE family protein n=1 Tax=unclassified Terrabacter TaxID=2630222 RepID=UPI00165D8D17|nr:SMP-30/gluconolactonase/LRE family protein [Terrabacter sp. MAHUQ-38]MBC9820788.1 SMP-30/gluconolactonase/LRE family protein [Terrabacter sp. MAHUQ-38]